MSLNEESPPPPPPPPPPPLIQTEGEEIQTIGYDSFLDISAANAPQNQENKEYGNRYSDSKEKSARDVRNKSKGIPEKNNGAGEVNATSSGNSSSSSSSSYDICRICHMGNPTSNRACLTSSEQDARRQSSSVNLDLGLLVSACRCRGTVGLVHTKCLERWLTESGHTRCELCGFRYTTVRVPRHGLFRSFLIWIKTFVATRQMLLDSLYLVVTTPLAVFSAYVCAMTLKMALENRVGEIPWTIVAMLPTCSLTLVAYWGWLLTLQRLHGRRWRQYWQSNFIVQLVPNDPANNDDDDNNRIREESDANQAEEEEEEEDEAAFEDLPDLFNLL